MSSPARAELQVYESESDWLAARRRYVTSSDVPVVLGVSPYGSPVELWEEKVRGRERDTSHMRRRFEAGHHFEPLVQRWFTEETGLHCYRASDAHHLAVSVEYPWLAASTDFEVDAPGERGECIRGGVEVKSSIISGRSDYLEGPAWPYAVAQLHGAMIVRAWSRGWVAVVFGLGNDFAVYPVERQEELAALIIERTREFAGFLEREEVPSSDWITAGRGVREALSRIYLDEAGVEVVLEGEELAADLDAYLAVRDQRLELERQAKRLKEEEELYQNRALAAMRGATFGIVPGRQKKWKAMTKRGGGSWVDPWETRTVGAVKA